MSDISILNIFEPKVRNNIIEFCKDLNATHADMYVVMARKAACLVSVLEKIGLLSLPGEVISERVMDCNIDWSKYGSVVIIDDVVISGTTLYQTINKIKRANSALQIELHVLGVNKKWYTDEILEREDGQSYIHAPIRRLDNSECIRLSGDIVRLLANYPLPYNIDYPIYNTLRLNDQGFDQIMTLPGWKVAEVSSFSNRKNGIITHTFLPDTETLEDIGPFYTTDLARHSLMKIRTYCRKRSDKKHAVYIMTIVPMFILPPIERVALQSLVAEFSGTNILELSTILGSHTASLRFVQFVLADLLARRFIQTINKLLHVNNRVEREYESLRYLFPSSIIELISGIADQYEGVVNKGVPFKEFYTTESKKANRIEELLDVNEVLTRPFLEMYYEDELSSRKLVLDCGKSAFDNSSYTKIVDRLKRGITFEYLLGQLNEISERERCMLVSSFLDRSIDAGIVVPITVEKDNLIYRAFRHGEDVQFGQQEERLCYDMLNMFSQTIGRNEIPKLWMEKMLVLLFQLGEGDVFMPIQTSIESYSHINGEILTDRACVKYYLQGPVVVRQSRSVPFEKQYLDHKDKADWMSSKLVRDSTSPVEKSESGMYTFDESKYHKLITGDNEIVIDNKKTEFAQKLGCLFGTLLCNEMRRQKPALSSDDLVMLTSSLESKNVIGAMAAEINICYEMYTVNDDKGVGNIIADIIANKSIAEEKFDVIRKSKWYQALNDGIRKFNWYCNGNGYNVINTVAAQFNDALYKTMWNGLWSPNMEKKGNMAKGEVVDLAYTEGILLLSAHAYYLMLYCLLSGVEAKGFQNAINKIKVIRNQLYQQKYKNLVREITKIVTDFLESCNTSGYATKMIPVIHQRLVDIIIKRCPKILRKANAYYLNSLNVPHVKYYNHALFVETMDVENGRIITALLEEIRLRINNSKERKNVGLILVQSTDNVLKLSEHQYIFFSNNASGLYWLLELAHLVSSKTRGCGGACMGLFSGLPPDYYIKNIMGQQIDAQSFGNLLLAVLEKIRDFPLNNNTLYVISVADADIVRRHHKFAKFSKIYEEPYPLDSFKKRNYKLRGYQEQDSEFNRKVDIAILTIVDEEAGAVRNGFGMSVEKSIVIKDRYYDYGEYTANSKTFKVVHLQCARQGNVSMAVAVCEVINRFNPVRVVLLGIAGGIRNDINLGDVVIADDVFYYDSRKELASGKVDRRLKSFTISNRTYNQIARYRYIWNHQVSERQRLSLPDFALHVAPIGTGEAVIGNSLSEITEWLRSVHSKTCAIETEAGGFLDAINEMSNNTIDYLIIRGISDKADVNKNDNYRRMASENAVEVLKDFIEKIFSNA